MEIHTKKCFKVIYMLNFHWHTTPFYMVYNTWKYYSQVSPFHYILKHILNCYSSYSSSPLVLLFHLLASIKLPIHQTLTLEHLWKRAFSKATHYPIVCREGRKKVSWRTGKEERKERKRGRGWGRKNRGNTSLTMYWFISSYSLQTSMQLHTAGSNTTFVIQLLSTKG